MKFHLRHAMFLARPRRDGTQRAVTGRNQELAALRSLAKVAVREQSWPANPTEGVQFARKAPRDPAFLGEGELRHLFRSAVERPPAGEGPQVLAVLGLLSQTALRVHELVALDVGQIDLPTGTLLSVRGKGGTVHDLPLNVPAVTLLTAWLRGRAARAPPGEKALFLSSRRTRLPALSTRAAIARKPRLLRMRGRPLYEEGGASIRP